MNLVGKIFVFLIMMMSVCFAMLAVGVYMAQTNWRDRVLLTKEDIQNKPEHRGKELGLKWQLEFEKKRYAELEGIKDDLEKRYKTEFAAKQQRIQALETEKTVLAAQHQEALKKHGELLVVHEGELAKVQAAQEKLNALRAEVETLKSEVMLARKKIDEQFGQVVIQTEVIHQLQLTEKSLKERNQQLTTELAMADRKLTSMGVTRHTPIDTSEPERPLDAVVTGVRIVDRDTYVQMSVGSDDGLMIGHPMRIYRGSTYLGKLTVIRTEPDKAVGRVDKTTQKGAIQVRDRVESEKSLRLTAG